MWPLDWVVLVTLILTPAALGIWRALLHTARGRRHGDDADPTRGDDGGVAPKAAAARPAAAKSMGVVTVGLSLLASNLSGITLLGYPAEVYRYGTQFWMVAVGAVLATAVLCVGYLPVLHGLRLSSSYEYLELRFDARVRKLTSIMYTVRLLLLLPLVLYVPALAFTQGLLRLILCLGFGPAQLGPLDLLLQVSFLCSAVTGMGIRIIAPAISVVCIVYTTVGGLRTVSLTGSMQLLIMLTASVAILAAGLYDVGGVGAAWRSMEASGRIEFFNLDPNPLTRTTFWSATVGGSFFWLQMLAVQPNSVQRYLAVPTLSAARRTAYLQCAGLLLTTTLACSLGGVLYAKYEGCDPLTTKEVQRADQLVALMVEQTSGRVPGLAGLFLAGLLSAAMGNLSAALNTLSSTLYADLVAGWLPDKWRSRSGVVVKVLGVLIGVWATLLVFVVERLGGLVQVAMSLGSVTSGTMLGLFTLGMLVPRANTLVRDYPCGATTSATSRYARLLQSLLLNVPQGALAGAAVSVLGTALVVFGQQSAIAAGSLHWPTKPSNADDCAESGSGLAALPGVLTEAAPSEVLAVLRLSYLWLVLLGAALTMVSGTIVSLLTSSAGAAAVDPALLFGRGRRQVHQHELGVIVAEKPTPQVDRDG
ncbi:hypothetical protein FOCC_FOCC000346 [Frankliniella occidentalis]|nr:hypothetical protein FOCC_FOCC000346 [Frankliniella occidentalis]